MKHNQLKITLTFVVLLLSFYIVVKIFLLKEHYLTSEKSCGYSVESNDDNCGACHQLNNQLAEKKRCQTLGGTKFNGSMYGGCDAEQSIEGNVSLCSGMSKNCSTSQSDKEKVSKYYGETSFAGIDEKSQYFKDVEKTVVAALTYIKKNAARCILNLHKHRITPAIMFDIDDTIFSTFPLAESQNFGYDAKKFKKAEEENNMPLIKPVAMFIFACKAMGILPIFVTGRRPANKNQTLEQLIVSGMVPGETFWGGATYNGEDLMRGVEKPSDVVPADVYAENGTIESFHGIFFNGSVPHLPASEYKEKVRCWIEKNGLANNPIKFIMSVGDQWSDSNGRCSGAKIKLPNPLYFLP